MHRAQTMHVALVHAMPAQTCHSMSLLSCALHSDPALSLIAVAVQGKCDRHLKRTHLFNA